MLPIKKIVCATDFSEPSYHAVKTASELAAYFDSELILVHVVAEVPALLAPPTNMAVPVPAPGINVAKYQREVEDSADKVLCSVAAENVPGNVSVRTVVMSGDAAEEIVRATSQEKADLLVISTHGLRGWRRLVFGSVTNKVLNMAPCPTLVITSPAEAEGETQS